MLSNTHALCWWLAKPKTQQSTASLAHCAFGRRVVFMSSNRQILHPVLRCVSLALAQRGIGGMESIAGTLHPSRSLVVGGKNKFEKQSLVFTEEIASALVQGKQQAGEPRPEANANG